jgi:hypothetical protein
MFIQHWYQSQDLGTKKKKYKSFFIWRISFISLHGGIFARSKKWKHKYLITWIIKFISIHVKVNNVKRKKVKVIFLNVEEFFYKYSCKSE